MAQRPTRRTKEPAGPWEAKPIELKAYVDRRLAAQAANVPIEPEWFVAELEASWEQALLEAEAS
jgi:hypothetical protein